MLHIYIYIYDISRLRVNRYLVALARDVYNDNIMIHISSRRVGTGLSVLWVAYASSNSSTIAAGSSNGVINTRCCRYSVCAPDDGWWYHTKHVEQFPNKINRVMLYLVGYILEYNYDARTHER